MRIIYRVLFVAAISAGASVTATVALAQDVNAGKQVFSQCSSCHAVDGNQGPSPDFTLARQ